MSVDPYDCRPSDLCDFCIEQQHKAALEALAPVLAAAHAKGYREGVEAASKAIGGNR